MRLGEYLRRYRCENKMTQEELADLLGCHPSHISFIENGWANKCTFRNLAKIVVCLKLTAEELKDIVITFYDTEVKQLEEKENAECNSE